MPAPIVGNQDPFYSPSGESIYSAYKTALSSVKLGVTPEFQQQIDRIMDRIDEAVARKKTDRMNYNVQWKYSGESEELKEQWTEDTGWSVKLKMYDDQLQSLQKQRAQLVAAANADYSEAIDTINDEKGFTKMMKAGKVAKVPNFEVYQNGVSWRDSVADNKGTATTFTLSNSHKYESRSSMQFSDSTSLFYVFSVGASGGYSKETMNVEKDRTPSKLSLRPLPL